MDFKIFDESISALVEHVVAGPARRMAEAVLNDAIDACPVDTGWLRDHLVIERVAKTWYVGSAVDYAIYPELGTSRMKAQPYLRPALYANRGVVK